MMHKGTALVTGAGGFLGRHTLPALVGTGWRVTAMLRPDSPTPPWCVGPGIEVRRADLLDAEALRRACTGANTVVHLAALLNIPLETRAACAALARVNTEGTATLLAACRATGVEELLLMSSVAALGDPERGRTADDTTPPRPGRAYGRTKLAAERLVAEARDAWGLRTVTLRPVVVYGEGDKGNVVKMIKAIRHRRFALVAGGRARKSLVYAGNLAAAVAHLLPLREGWEGKNYIAMDPRPYSLAELAGEMARALGIAPPRLRLPALPLRLAGGALEGVCRPFGVRPLFSAHTVAKLTDDLLYDGSRLGRDTGFAPPYTLAEGLRRTVADLDP